MASGTAMQTYALKAGDSVTFENNTQSALNVTCVYDKDGGMCAVFDGGPLDIRGDAPEIGQHCWLDQ